MFAGGASSRFTWLLGLTLFEVVPLIYENLDDAAAAINDSNLLYYQVPTGSA